MRAVAAVLCLSAAAVVTAVGPNNPASYTNPVPPFHVIDSVYYVGTEELGAYLVKGKDGAILVDAGVQENADTVAKSIASLGFNLHDVKVLLTTQAHFDRVGALARLKALTGASLLVSQGDAGVVEHGGRGDYFFGPSYYFPPAHVDGIVNDGRVVSVGGVQLTAHLTPGHTKGCTTWTMEVRAPEGALREACFVGSPTVNPDVPLVSNPKYPRIADDYRRTFTVLRSLTCDVFLPAHSSYVDFQATAARARAGAGPAAFVNAAVYRDFVAAQEKVFQQKLAAQQQK